MQAAGGLQAASQPSDFLGRPQPRRESAPAGGCASGNRRAGRQPGQPGRGGRGRLLVMAKRLLATTVFRSRRAKGCRLPDCWFVACLQPWLWRIGCRRRRSGWPYLASRQPGSAAGGQVSGLTRGLFKFSGKAPCVKARWAQQRLLFAAKTRCRPDSIHPDQLLVDEFLNACAGQFTAVAGIFHAAKRQFGRRGGP